MKWFKKLIKPSKQYDFMTDFKRQMRNKRYYQKHKEELKQKRREYYSIYGK